MGVAAVAGRVDPHNVEPLGLGGQVEEQTGAVAALGGELEVPTLDGRVKLKVPAETQTGKLFRLRGKGVKPVRGGSIGDLLCRVVVETPVNLSKQQKELLDEFRSTLGEGGKSQSPRQTSWFEGVKNFFDDMTS